MEDSYEQEKTTETSTLIGQPSAPPAYDEEPPTVQPPNVQPRSAQPVPQMGQYPQVQVGGTVPQAWPQGYPVSSLKSLPLSVVMHDKPGWIISLR